MRRRIHYLIAILTSLAWLFAGLSAATAQDARAGSTAPSQALYLPVISGGAGAAPVIHSFTASPATIPEDGSVTLTWDVSGATSLSIVPGIGAVQGVNITVAPATTTQYTLTAANATGSVTAQTTVTVVSAPTDVTGFFLVPTPNIELPTSHPTVAVDPAGGVHVAFTPQSATPQNPTRPAYYAYCAANCINASAFTILHLGDGVDFASLALDPLGRPRLLLRMPAQSGAIFIFQYWACDNQCLALDQWRSGAIGYTYARPVGWVEPFIRSFTLDQAGRPRFVYYDNGADHEDAHRGVFYAYCDSDCTNAAQWRETRLLDDPHARDFDLAFGPNGQPRLVYVTYNSEALAQPVVYAECNQMCHLAESWSTTLLADTAAASVSHFAVFALATDSDGKPHVALYTGTGVGGSLAPNTLYYLTCDAPTCAQTQAWFALNLSLPATHGEEGVDLAFDASNRPRLAYHAPMGAGFGLHYAWCDSNCGHSTQGWRTQQRETSEEVNAALPIPPWPGCAFPQCNPPIPPCTISTWDSGLRPALAFDAAGNPRIAFDANHEQGGGCGTFTDTKQSRFIQFAQP